MNNRTILIAAGTGYGSTTFGIAQGFRDLGWTVYEIDTNNFFIRPRSYFMKAVAKATRYFSAKDYNSAILDVFSLVKPNIFMTVKGSYLEKSTLEFIGNSGALRINYYPDFRFTYPDVDQNTFHYYDQFITTKSFQVDYLRKELGEDRVQFLHHGYVGSVHKPPKSAKIAAFSTDLLYVGTYSAPKEEWLTKMVEKTPDVSIKIFGAGWNKIKPGSNLRPFIQPLSLDPDSYAIAVNGAKINLGIHMGVSDPSGWYDLVSTRTFEIPACKGFMLHVDNREVRQLFAIGEEIDVFDSAENLCEKIEFYLRHDAIREQMVERAYQRCVPAYSYNERARVIADWISNRQTIRHPASLYQV